MVLLDRRTFISSGKWEAAEHHVLMGNSTYLDPKRVSEAFMEDRTLVGRLRRGPGESQNDRSRSDR